MGVSGPVDVLVVGGGGHAKVVIEILASLPLLFRPSAVTDTDPGLLGGAVLGVPVAGDDGAWEQVAQSGVRHAVVAIGDNQLRLKLAARLVVRGFTLITAVHPSAWVSPSAELGPGTVVMPGATINACARVGASVIVNTNSSVDHDCEVGDGCHVAPGAHLGGCVRLGRGVMIGLGASVIPGVTVGSGTTIGSGAVVVRDIPSGVVAVGVPARPRVRA